MVYNVWYKKAQTNDKKENEEKIKIVNPYEQVIMEEAVKISKRFNNPDDFKCFQFRHFKEGVHTKTETRMVNINNTSGIIEYTNWQ